MIGGLPYDANGNPQTLTLTRYYFGGALEISGSTVKKYYSFAGQTVAMKEGSTFKYFLSDHLGSVSMVLYTDGTGEHIEQQRYLPFGQPRATSPAITSTDFTYTGQRNLPDTGLMDYKARFYSPAIGRFLQPDTLIPGFANPQSWNRFSYVSNNPVRYNDPTGHMQASDNYEDNDGKCDKNDKGCNDLVERINIKQKHKPGEPRCKTKFCNGLVTTFTAGAFIADAVGLEISIVEAAIATYAYGAATVVCVESVGVGCGPAFGTAFAFDVLASGASGLVENTLGVVSTGLTVINDLVLGNTGLDPDIGPYIGKDTIVSARNSSLGLIPESYVDLLTSASQFKYDIDRTSGNKSGPGGYVPLADMNSNWKMPPFHKDFLKQIFVEDWW